ncbi:E3 ubiquitin-protein ligase TTC3-like isoform X2 [Heterodontus francisci]|uniref:E3 ubiquitin-protein ligase TTC3-like isoform X2 n=1 Tax=Heterodontus francisci TaxID=7792 RepID=UPI00355C2A13
MQSQGTLRRINCPQLMSGEIIGSCTTEGFRVFGDSVKERNEVPLDYDAAAHVQKELNECSNCLPEQNGLFAVVDNPDTFGHNPKDRDTRMQQGGVQILDVSTVSSADTDTSAEIHLCNPETPGAIKGDDTILSHEGSQRAIEDDISPGVEPVGTEAHRYKNSSSPSVDTEECLYSAEPAKVMDLEEKPETTSANLSPETTDQKHDTTSTNVSLEATGQVESGECDAALTNITASDSDLSSSETQAPVANLESTLFAIPQFLGTITQDSDDIYESDPENRAEEELADYLPDVPDAHTVTGMVQEVQQSVPCIDYRETIHPYLSNYIGQSWITDAPEGQFPKALLGESLSYNELTSNYRQSREKWSTGDAVPTGEEGRVEKLYQEELNEELDSEHNSLKELPPLRSLADSAVQTDCATVDAEVITDQDVEKYMNEVTAEREVLKERYQEVLDRQTQMENQLQVKVRRLQQRQEEEENIYQNNVKQVQEMKVKLEELKKKSEKEKKEFIQKEQELKNEVVKLYENGKRLMKAREEKGNLVAILISDQSDKKEKLNEDLAKLRLQHKELNKNILEETERALKAEVQSLESKREVAVMMLDKAANEAELQIYNLSSIPASSDLAHEWRRRLNDIQIQKENIKNQYHGHIQMVKNGAKLCSLPHIQLPNLPPAPPEVVPDLVLQRTWQFSPVLPSFFPSNMPASASFQPYPANLPTAPSFPPGSGAQSEFEGHSALPTSKPATKLEKLLEKLETKFPSCSRAQLTHILQQIKTSRGTIAGLSVDELMHQVAGRLSESEQPQPVHPVRVSTTMPGHFPPAASQTSPYLSLPKGRTGAQASYQESPALVSGSPRLCLMCQKVVPVSKVHPMACSHIVHKECIKFWAQFNKNSSCPYCPTPR